MSAAALPALKKTGQAVVINTTVPPHFLRGQNWWVSHMQSAKAAVTTLSQSMAKEWAEYGIRCCNVAPGAIADTPAALKQGSRSALTSEAELSPDGIPVASHVPLGRMGTHFLCCK
jgi:NAD(P)-dependent dehydrogenase (short-subunit alcohol dehydrogenase family)|eukprot:COSAG06_NODE_4841_length_3916_cov_1.775478_2_plen_116_part_00